MKSTLSFGSLLRIFALLCAVVAASGAGAADKRVALLIGNNTYSTAPLRNAVNDARDLGEVLTELGFKTIVRENTTRQDMIAAIRDFSALLDGAETGLFFYAGHAMQFKDRNYLIPVDADLRTEEDVTFSSVEVGQVFDRMERARTRFNFIVLDACRDNPFASSFKVTSAGLAQIANAPSGTLVAYATAPGSVAQDGYQRNGVYTQHILQQIRVPDLPVEIMFKRVREAVERDTRRAQTPWDVSSLKGDFVFNSSVAGGRQASRFGDSASTDATLAIEREFWVSVRDSSRVQDVQAYLDKYPRGQYIILARSRIDALIRPTTAVAVIPDKEPAVALSPLASAAGAAAPRVSATAAEPGAATKLAAITPRKPAEPVANKPDVSLATTTAEPTAKPDARVVASVAPTDASVAKTKPPTPVAEVRDVEPGIREVAFPDGSLYRGGLRGSALHGAGEYVSKDGFKYRGDFVEGQKQGKGTYTWPSGDSFEGEFANDVANGNGTYKFANGDKYVGEVKNGAVSGRGVYTTLKGDQIEGAFLDGKAGGKGVYRFASGDKYEGDMVQGRLTGKGVFTSVGGDRIEGEFLDGRPTGGIYHFTNGDRYEGEMKDGLLTGRGTYFHSSGLKYEGDMVLGKPNGRGTFWLGDGTRFEGVFEDGLKRAKGQLVDQAGKKVEAEIIESAVRLLGR